jgi:P-type conjugative transfer protein TrbG
LKHWHVAPVLRAAVCIAAVLAPLAALASGGAASAGQAPVAMPQDTRLVVFRYDPNESYLLLTRPGAVTHIALEPDESVVAFALGDTVQWLVQDKGPNVFLKPLRADLYTSGTLVTNRRTYQLGLRSSPEGGAWYQRVSWAQPGLIVPRGEPPGRDAPPPLPAVSPPRERPATDAPRIDRLNFDYRISGRASFRPVQVLDDGRFTYLQMPIGLQELPAFFVGGETGEGELVNYLVRGRFVVVHRLADRFLLRLGRAQVVVERTQSAAAEVDGRGRAIGPVTEEVSQ